MEFLHVQQNIVNVVTFLVLLRMIVNLSDVALILNLHNVLPMLDNIGLSHRSKSNPIR